MRVTTRMVIAACGALLGGTALSGTAQAAPGQPGQDTPSAAQPTQCLDPFQGDWSLGPKELPKQGAVGSLVKGYARFGTYPTARSFLNDWKDNDWNWIYPKNDGFDGQPTTVTLSEGTTLDRFGSTNGTFLSPVEKSKAALYQERAIPPSNLHTYSGDVECNYHQYKVMKGQSLNVLKGKIAPAFGQSGGGTQVKLGVPVKDLLNKVLEDATPGRSRTSPRPATPLKPVANRADARAALARAGVPDAYYRIDSVHEPRLPATEFYRLRKTAGQWVVTLNERGKDRLVARYADESRASQRLFQELVASRG